MALLPCIFHDAAGSAGSCGCTHSRASASCSAASLPHFAAGVSGAGNGALDISTGRSIAGIAFDGAGYLGLSGLPFPLYYSLMRVRLGRKSDDQNSRISFSCADNADCCV
jgi:hypothetical protein